MQQLYKWVLPKWIGSSYLLWLYSGVKCRQQVKTQFLTNFTNFSFFSQMLTFFHIQVKTQFSHKFYKFLNFFTNFNIFFTNLHCCFWKCKAFRWVCQVLLNIGMWCLTGQNENFTLCKLVVLRMIFVKVMRWNFLKALF